MKTDVQMFVRTSAKMLVRRFVTDEVTDGQATVMTDGMAIMTDGITDGQMVIMIPADAINQIPNGLK